MTMLSPLGRVPKQRPPGPRRARRPVPALILIAALSVLAAMVWWRVLHRGSDTSPTSNACRTPPTVAALTLDPHKVRIRVYNATEHAGLARTVADQLHRRGFAIATTSNDPLSDTRQVQGVGELRYGRAGANQALLVSLHLPGVKLAEDPRTDAIVDVAIGPGFRAIATAAQLKQARQTATAKVRAKPAAGAC
jgi:hypothetical protein